MLTCTCCKKDLVLKEIEINTNSVFELYLCPDCEEKATIDINLEENTKVVKTSLKVS